MSFLNINFIVSILSETKNNGFPRDWIQIYVKKTSGIKKYGSEIICWVDNKYYYRKFRGEITPREFEHNYFNDFPRLLTTESAKESQPK